MNKVPTQNDPVSENRNLWIKNDFYLFLYIVQFQVGNTPSPDLSGEKHEDEAEPLPGLIAVKKKAKKKGKQYKVSQKCRVKKTPKKCSNKERS